MKTFPQHFNPQIAKISLKKIFFEKKSTRNGKTGREEKKFFLEIENLFNYLFMDVKYTAEI